MRTLTLTSLLALALTAAASAQTPARAPPPPASPITGTVPPSAQAALRLPGYLGKAGVPDSILILPPPPVAGSTEDRLDTETYADTRKMAGTPRGDLATRDATHYIQAFDCPLGIRLEDGPPAVGKLFLRVGRDAAAITNLAKDHYGRSRPFIATNGPICTESDRAGLIKSPSYPSGHTTYSWAMGLILAEIAPDKASQILARARAFGESRVVCGVHTVSDVEEGRTNGAALVAVLHSNPAFQADLEAAKTALAAARTAPHAAPDAAECKIEAAAEEHTPWINPTGTK
jgi:acid phosphatase (class A)